MTRQGGRAAPIFRTLTIEDLAGRGDAVARLPSGEVVFVPGGAPGDRVHVRIDGKRGGVRRGTIVTLHEPGHARVRPPCPVAEECGGCAWLHVALPEQRRVKATLAARAVRPDPPPTLVGEAPALGWRRRARLHLRRVAGRAEIGLLQSGSDALVPLAGCPALVPELSAWIAPLRERLAPYVERGEVLLSLGAEGVVAAVHGKRRGDAPDAAAVDAIAAGLRGLYLDLEGVIQRRGEDEITLLETRDDAAPIRSTAGGFAQASVDGNRAIRAQVRAALDAVLAERGRPFATGFEAFAGSGNLTATLLAAAESARTIEFDPAAVSRARRSLEPVFGDRLRIEEGDANEALRLPAGPDAVWLLDPGRPGAAGLCAAAAHAEPAAIVYVSCAPDTLRRDLQTLRAAGYQLSASCWLDTMPQTPHFELVCTLVRAAG